MKWSNDPNLRTQIRRAFTAAGASAVSASEIYDWCYARRRLVFGKSLPTRHRYSVWRILRKIAEPIGRVGPRHAILWRLRNSGAEK
jgi:hypothetical protein